MSITVDAKTYEEFLGGFSPSSSVAPLFEAYFEIAQFINGIKNSSEIKKVSGLVKYDFVDVWTKLQALPGMVTSGDYFLLLHLEDIYILLSRVIVSGGGLVDTEKLENIAKHIRALSPIKDKLRAEEMERLSH